MKVKLLKKIRKDWSIVDYPKGHTKLTCLGVIFYDESHLYVSNGKFGKRVSYRGKKTKNKAYKTCLEFIFFHTKQEYFKYSRKYKTQNKPTKIWYNG